MSSYFVVFVPDEAAPETYELPSRDELIQRLRDLLSRNGYVRIFRGEQLYLSKAPYRCLLEEGQAPLPIFDFSRNVEQDAEGRTGDEPGPDPLYQMITQTALRSQLPKDADKSNNDDRDDDDDDDSDPPLGDEADPS